MAGYAVIDFETTGLSPAHHDWVVEIGVVQVSDTGEVEGEWSTLVNPQRDVGPTHIHGITARDVANAPTFADLVPSVVHSLAGRALVAHNLSFDRRFLVAELERAGVAVPDVPPLSGICTMQWSTRFLPVASRRLSDCAEAAELPAFDQHSALHDARAAAGLLTTYLRACSPPPPWSAEIAGAADYPWPPTSPALATCGLLPRSRPAERRPDGWLDRVVARMPRQPNGSLDSYLEVLESALLDRYLAAYEEDALIETAQALGLGRDALAEIHRDYLRSMAEVALADGVVTDPERAELEQVAALLGLTASDVDVALSVAPSRRASAEFQLRPGDCICLTGAMRRERSEWERLLTAAGLVAGGLTKRTRLLVAADPDSASGKAHKARAYGVPIVTETALERLLAAMSN